MSEPQPVKQLPRTKKQKPPKEPKLPPPPPAPKPIPPTRRMIPVKTNPVQRPLAVKIGAAPLRTFTMMSYNILARELLFIVAWSTSLISSVCLYIECLVRRTLFPYCSKEDLKHKPRLSLLIEEITKTHQPDVACLQEVDRLDLIKADFEGAGYEWVYIKKHPEREDGHGLCVLWKKAKWVLSKSCAGVVWSRDPA